MGFFRYWWDEITGKNDARREAAEVARMKKAFDDAFDLQRRQQQEAERVGERPKKKVMIPNHPTTRVERKPEPSYDPHTNPVYYDWGSSDSSSSSHDCGSSSSSDSGGGCDSGGGDGGGGGGD